MDDGDIVKVGELGVERVNVFGINKVRINIEDGSGEASYVLSLESVRELGEHLLRLSCVPENPDDIKCWKCGDTGNMIALYDASIVGTCDCIMGRYWNALFRMTPSGLISLFAKALAEG